MDYILVVSFDVCTGQRCYTASGISSSLSREGRYCLQCYTASGISSSLSREGRYCYSAIQYQGYPHQHSTENSENHFSLHPWAGKVDTATVLYSIRDILLPEQER
ncbi:hypothetical protein PoB_003003200 [Plakobranchus ocellatus]|uniref:Uncharacterized protein n=1 Tax=Plakobranchus ocellatus TaxID=259542 RepID=A0AAV4A9A8_9GAST|nr:hypothetical protein PoB_003003200 [Plakobranchus ocellatus]